MPSQQLVARRYGKSRGGYETNDSGHRVPRAARHTLLIRIVRLNGVSGSCGWLGEGMPDQ